MSTSLLLHTSPLSSHFHWEYQILVLLALAGLWLFLAGRAERHQRRADSENKPVLD
jgi:hypothetical protein